MKFPIQPDQRAPDADTAAARWEYLHLRDIARRPFVLVIYLIIIAGFACSLTRLVQTAVLVNESREEVSVLCGGMSHFIDNQPANASVALILQAMSHTFASRHFEGDPLRSWQAKDMTTGFSEDFAKKVYTYLLFVSCFGVITLILARPSCWNMVLTRRCSKHAFLWIILGGMISTILEAVAVWLATKRELTGLTITSVLICICTSSLLAIDVLTLLTQGNLEKNGPDSIELITREVREIPEVYGCHRAGTLATSTFYPVRSGDVDGLTSQKGVRRVAIILAYAYNECNGKTVISTFKDDTTILGNSSALNGHSSRVLSVWMLNVEHNRVRWSMRRSINEGIYSFDEGDPDEDPLYQSSPIFLWERIPCISAIHRALKSQ